MTNRDRLKWIFVLVLAVFAVLGGPALAQTPTELTTLQILRDKGIITKEEFERAAAGQPVTVTPAEPAPVLSRWSAGLYGFVEFDSIYDSTQSYNDLAGNGLIARPDTYAGQNGRWIFGVRNSRIGFKLRAPEFHKIVASAQLEMDFLGNQPTPVSEAAFITSPTFRIRHFYLKLENPWVDVLIGQYWQLFGWQSYFHPNTVEIQGALGQVYSRTPQVRLSHVFKSAQVNLEVAVAAARPAQRDSYTPDGHAGLKLSFNKWTGLNTVGSSMTGINPMAIGVSGLIRRFSLPEFSAKPQDNVSTMGWGVSVDALVPIIPARNGKRGNSLTLNGSFVYGAGIADLYTGLNGGIGFATLPSSSYTPDVDPGLVAFDKSGQLQTINWQSFWVGAQYYLPPSGRVWISSNFSQLNLENYIPDFGAANKVVLQFRRADANLFIDVTPAVRLGLAYIWLDQLYADNTEAVNHRAQLSAFYLF